MAGREATAVELLSLATGLWEERLTAIFRLPAPSPASSPEGSTARPRIYHAHLVSTSHFEDVEDQPADAPSYWTKWRIDVGDDKWIEVARRHRDGAPGSWGHRPDPGTPKAWVEELGGYLDAAATHPTPSSPRSPPPGP